MAACSTAFCSDRKSKSDQFDYYMEAFGCHLQWKELDIIGRHTLERERTILAKDEWDYNTRPTYYTAVRNLQGYVAYRLEEEDEAKEFFEDVLKHDPNNINALANLLFIARENETHETAREYQALLEEIFEGRNYEHRARAYADRAHAIRYFEQDKRCFHYMEYIERACVIGSSCLTPHRVEWFFDLALVLYRRDVQMLYLRKLWSKNGIALDENHDLISLNKKIKAGFVKAAHLLYDIIQISNTNEMKALAWVFLGILLNHDPSERNYSDVFPDDEHGLHDITADECYQYCVNFGGNHAIALRRVGSEYVKLGRFKEAEVLLQRSLAIIESWFAFRHTGLMYLAKYDQSSEEGNPKRQYLKEAEVWLKKAQKFKKVHADYSDLGRVYFLLGEHDKAISQFRRATSNDQDDFFDLVETHRRWADCLGAKGELEGQREQQIKANKLQLQLQEPQTSEDDFFRDDFEFYNTPTRPGFVRFLLGTHIWCTESQRIATQLAANLTLNPREHMDNGRRYRYHFFISYAERDRRWTFAFLHKLESKHSLRGCINHRDFVAGVSEPDNRTNAIRNSHKCVVILTPAFVEELAATMSRSQRSWTSYELVQAVTESQFRSSGYIIPIMLRACTPPTTISHLTYSQCCDGQMAQNHWDKLIENITSQDY
ncbi:uncharacterized protein [Amphiura filiformis]|uniref:uncharacterized protein n=1 Tax=Amphiura filiformis TaxID=82378 RepID=UPI003B20CC8C